MSEEYSTKAEKGSLLVAELVARNNSGLQFSPEKLLPAEMPAHRRPAPEKVAGVRDSRSLLEPRKSEGERLAAMDALRGGAMLLGIFVHAAISYMPTNLEQLFWGIREKQTSTILDGLFWWVHACRLPLFFVIAGFFAVLVVESKGIAGFLKHRFKRLFVPYTIGILALLPIGFLYGWCSGLLMKRVQSGLIQDFELDAYTRREILGPLHLWFLQDLIILSAIFIVVRWLVKGRKGEGEKGRRGEGSTVGQGGASGSPSPLLPLSLSLFLPFALALPTMLLLWYDSHPLTAHHNTFIPDVERLLYYGLFFGVGILLYRRRQSLTNVFAWPGSHLALSLVPGSLMLILLPDFLKGVLDPWGRLTFATCAALLAWLTIFGFTGLALRCFRGRHPLANYLADSSYWVYLVHLPIICLIQLALFEIPIHPLLKCGLVMVLTGFIGLGTYHTMVRYTFIGTWLNGPRMRRGAEG